MAWNGYEPTQSWNGYAVPHLPTGSALGPTVSPTPAVSSTAPVEPPPFPLPGVEPPISVPAPPPPPRTSAGQDSPAVQRALPRVGQGDPYWNVNKCMQGIHCTDSACRSYHAAAERRCPCQTPDRCQNQGAMLHVRPEEVNQTWTVDLQCPRDVLESIGLWEAMPRDERAKVVRLVVLGYSWHRASLLRRVCRQLPLLHEIALPDHMREANLLVRLCDTIEECAESNPCLREVIFEDGRSEALWT